MKVKCADESPASRSDRQRNSTKLKRIDEEDSRLNEEEADNTERTATRMEERDSDVAPSLRQVCSETLTTVHAYFAIRGARKTIPQAEYLERARSTPGDRTRMRFILYEHFKISASLEESGSKLWEAIFLEACR
jgi:hypothetical protein